MSFGLHFTESTVQSCSQAVCSGLSRIELRCWCCAAFDKGDLLYLRDEEEKKRFKEEELRDSERLQFLRMQASTSTPKEAPAPLPPKAPNPDNPPQK